jgi:hypothetical protein
MPIHAVVLANPICLLIRAVVSANPVGLAEFSPPSMTIAAAHVNLE